MTSLFTPKQTPTPEPAPVAPMPDSNAPAVTEAARLESQRIMGRAGRTSTILTRPENRGSNRFDSFAAPKLGTGS